MNSLVNSLRELESVIVEEIFGAATHEKLLQGAVERSALRPYVPLICELASYYEGDSSKRLNVYDSYNMARAYALYYMPVNFAKIFMLTKLLPELRHSQKLRVLDFGCGPGTAGLALCHNFSGELNVHAVDKSKSMRELALAFWRRYVKKLGNATFKVDTPPLEASKAKYDLIIASNVLCEMDSAKALQLLLRLCVDLSPEGTLLLLEPGNFNAARSLMGIRDKLISAEPELTPTFPCTHRKECHMLKSSESDWCHGMITWERSYLVREVDRLTGFNKHRLKFSALILKRGSPGVQGYRVVSIPRRDRRGHCTTLCGDNLYGEVLLPKSNKSAANEMFTRLELYDHISLTPPPNELLLDKSCVVSRLGRIIPAANENA